MLFFYIEYYITKVKSKAISKKIIRISERIKKSLLDILSASFLIEVGKHSTVKYSLQELYQTIVLYTIEFDTKLMTI